MFALLLVNKQKLMKLNDQKNLSKNEIILDTLVFKKDEKVYYFSDAVIMSIASLGGIYKSIYILKLFPKRIRDFIYNIFAKNRHLMNKMSKFDRKLSKHAENMFSRVNLSHFF